MAKTDAVSRPLSGAGLGLAAALAVSLPGALASLEVFAFGFWERAEPVVAHAHAAAAVAAMALAAFSIVEPQNAARLFRQPLVLVPGCVAVWSALTAPFAAYPLLGILGPPQSGQGALWYADLAILVACAAGVAQHRGAWRALSAVAIAVSLTVAALKTWQVFSGRPVLIPVSGFYAYLGFTLPIIVMPLRSAPWLAIALFAAAAVLAVSMNVTAWIFAAIAAAYLLLTWLPPLRHKLDSKGVSSAVILLAALIPYALVRWLEPLLTIPSIRSRNLLLRVMEHAQSGDALGFIIGHGWGHTQDALAAHLNASSEILWQANWDYLWRDYFHSHNWLAESLYAIGVPGAALLLALILAPALVCRPEHRRYATAFAICLAGLDGFWIQLAFLLPFLALAYTALTARSLGESPAPYRTTVIGPACAIAAAGLLIAAVTLIRFGFTVAEVRKQLATHPPAAIALAFPRGPAGDSLAMAEALRTALAQIAPIAEERERAAYRPQVEWIAAQLERAIPGTHTVLLPMTGLSLMAMLHVSNELAWARDAVPGSEAIWGQWVVRLLELAPDRSDAAIPYLSHLLAQNRLAELDEMVRRLRRHHADDPVALYFAGAAMTARPSPAEKRAGLNLIGRSIRAGIERYMPVPDWLKRAATLP